MSSRVLRSLPFEHKYLNLAVQETVKRAPINLRPLFGVEQRQNFMGTALFAMANFTADRLLEKYPEVRGSNADTGNGELDQETAVDYAEEGIALCDWLLEDSRDGYDGFCGGHNHVIQGLNHQGPISDPDLVSTSCGVKALLRGAEFDESYAETARTAADWAVEDMDYREVDGGAKITYYPEHSDDSYTLNAGAIAARMFVDLYDYFGDSEYRRYAENLLAFIVNEQTSIGGWYYRVPVDSSHLSMDNHHNGFIIESLQRYREVTGDTQFRHSEERALDFYRTTLFDSDGAPNWDEQSTYPQDIHGATQGILVFTYAGQLDFARRIIDWSREHLSDGDGRFFFRKHRFYTKRITLMRWCQAWMTYAISEFLRVVSDGGDSDGLQ